MRKAIFLLSVAAACGDKAQTHADSVAQAAPAQAGATTPASASAATSTPLPAGEMMLDVPGGKIWYKVSGPGAGIPVILLHGGPGFSSYYLKSLEALSTDRPVVRYDQLGGGKSDRITDTTMFTIDHFVRELEALRARLNYEKVNIVGHSWGTILGLEYYRAYPERVASLTLASASLDIPAWEKHARELIRTLSDSAQRAIKTREAEKKFDAPDYQAALQEFYGKYVWRRPVEADLDSTFKSMNEGIYGHMWGPSEFTTTGTLKPYNATAFLKTVKIPTLFTVGEFDEANPATIKKQAAMVPGARVHVIPGAAHITTWDNPDVMTKVVREFLRSVDSTANRR